MEMTRLRSRARWMARARRSLWRVRSIVVIMGNSYEKRGRCLTTWIIHQRRQTGGAREASNMLYFAWMKTTQYFLYTRQRADRAMIRDEWIEQVIQNPLREERQSARASGGFAAGPAFSKWMIALCALSCSRMARPSITPFSTVISRSKPCESNISPILIPRWWNSPVNASLRLRPHHDCSR